MLEKLAKEHLINNTNAILRFDDVIHAFSRYTIRRGANSYQVFRGATLAAEPSSSKIAISWCIADKYGKNALAQELIYLDLEIERRANEIMYYRNILSKSQDEIKKYVTSDRMMQSQARLKHAQELLDKCLNSAKYWQQKGFKDETARIGIKNPNTTKPEGV